MGRHRREERLGDGEGHWIVIKKVAVPFNLNNSNYF